MVKEKIRNFIIHSLKYILSKEYRELSRIRQLPRYSSFKTKILGNELIGVDGASFVATYNELFKKEIYDFHTANNSPFIIDCGANIGLSIIFFKQKFPSSRIIAFEPDPVIFATLKNNLEANKLYDVDIINKAVWIKDTNIKFISEGGESGRIINQCDNSHTNVIEVKTQSFKNLLRRKIDFLKIDIEGAEYDVINDCRDKLSLVECLFVEYHSHQDEKQKLGELLSILSNAGFRYHIKESYTVAKPFIERPAMLDMDLQLNIFCYRN